ncbi:MAG: nitrous oxide reductase family maturation protein NosD [Cyclobacteriaceae bacterium]
MGRIVNLCIGLLLWLITNQIAVAEVIKVGSDHPYSKISDAIAAAAPFDTVLLANETFFEINIRIDKPLTLKGTHASIIDGELQDEILVIAADSVVVSGITVQNVGYSFIKDRAGIRVEEKDYALIENCQLFNTFFGVYLQKSNHTTVRGNLIEGSDGSSETYTGNAIHMWYCEEILVENNITRYHRDGIYLEFVNHSEVHGNTSFRNIRYGLHFMFSNYDNYSYNTFEDNGSGVAVMFSKWINMKHNRFLNNWGSASFGLLLKEIYDGELSNNLFEDNTIAIHAEGANRILIANNVLRNNGWALKIMGNCFENRIEKNNFLGNNFNVATNSRKTMDTYEENYWDDYSGYDLDEDGFGDVPHRPVKLFAYIVERVPISIVMLRSLFIEMINVAEYIIPSLTPENLVDSNPVLQPHPL